MAQKEYSLFSSFAIVNIVSMNLQRKEYRRTDRHGEMCSLHSHVLLLVYFIINITTITKLVKMICFFIISLRKYSYTVTQFSILLVFVYELN